MQNIDNLTPGFQRISASSTSIMVVVMLNAGDVAELVYEYIVELYIYINYLFIGCMVHYYSTTLIQFQ
jgi:hypothetical protein